MRRLLGTALVAACGITLAFSPAFADNDEADAPQKAELPQKVSDNAARAEKSEALPLVAPPPKKVYFIPGTEKLTAVSGKAGLGKKRRLGPDPGSWGGALTGAHFSEDGDKPCRVEAYSDFLDSSSRSGTGWVWDDVGCTGKSPKKIQFTGDRYVHAIQMCDNGKTGNTGYRLKGLKMWSARIDRKTAKVMKEDANPSKWERPNCNNNWKKKVACGADKVARSLQIQTDAGDDWVTGVALQCAKIELRAWN
jgi:hypothetical protein